MGQKSYGVNEVYLLPWFEIVGTYKGLSVNDGYVYLTISNKTLSFAKDSNEAKYVQENLDDGLVGRRIAVLRTDIPEKSLCIRVINEQAKS